MCAGFRSRRVIARCKVRPGDAAADDSLGDSGCSILRDGKIVYSTKAGTHYFNCPVSDRPRRADLRNNCPRSPSRCDPRV